MKLDSFIVSPLVEHDWSTSYPGHFIPEKDTPNPPPPDEYEAAPPEPTHNIR